MPERTKTTATTKNFDLELHEFRDAFVKWTCL